MSEKDEVKEPAPSFTAKSFGLLWSATALLTIFTYWQEPLFLNLASAFRFQLLLALTCFSLPPFLLFRGRRRLLFVALPVVLLLTFASYFLPLSPSRTSGAPPLHLATTNLYSGNRGLNRFTFWLKEYPADILGLLEVAPHHTQSLADLGYEWSLVEPRADNFGIALLSREVPLQSRLLEAESSTPSVWAEYQDYQVLLTHPRPPLNKEARVWGDEQIVDLAALLSQIDKPIVVLGDLNATGWDLRLLPFRELGLKDGRKGHGFLPTWPVGKTLLQIPIDHILVPSEWDVLECARGPDIGSDHYPLRAVVERSKTSSPALGR